MVWFQVNLFDIKEKPAPICDTWQLTSLLLPGAGALQVSGFLLRVN
jgi:hypothetical protein